MSIPSDIFLLRDTQGPILYAPLHGVAVRVNEAAVGVVGRHMEGRPLDEAEAHIIAMLSEHGFFAPAELPEDPEDDVFAPTIVTLFPSDGCNLRCRYCYASADVVHHCMPEAVGRAAIDFVSQNALLAGKDEFIVGFHGNGEPFSRFDTLRTLCLYARERADRLGLDCGITAATNGVLTDEQLDFLIAYFDAVNISFDGLPDIQDRQRPFPDGSGSFAWVDRTLRRLERTDIDYGIRVTVTADSVSRIGEIAQFVQANYPHCTQLHIEPAWECGRCLTLGEHTADAEAFAHHFLQAERARPADGVPLVYSTVRYGQTATTFCAAGRGGFTITAKGDVTACYEVCDGNDPRSDVFLFGRYNADTGRFDFDAQKLARLGRLRVQNMAHCNDCFCRWHCAGDCSAKLLGSSPPEAHRGSDRCHITRALTLHHIRRALGNDGTDYKEGL